MVVGGDIGFGFQVTVAVFVLFIGAVAGVLASRKWQREAERREEVQRLLVVASGEAAQLEATASYIHSYDGYGYDEVYGNGYVFPAEVVEDQPLGVASGPSIMEEPGTVANSQSLMYPCALCSRLSKARCKQCKSVHYCSGKCQITHWRLGHKNECHPFRTAHQNNGLGVASHLKVSKEEKSESYGYGLENEGYSKPLEASFGEPTISNSVSRSVDDGKCDIELDHFVDEKGRHPTGLSGSCVDASHDFGGRDRYLSEDNDVGKNQTGSATNPKAKPPISGLTVLVSSLDSDVTSHKSSQIKLGSGDGDKISKLSDSSNLRGSGSTRSTLCEPSTSSSGFWEGKLLHNRSRTNAPDDISHSCSSEADENGLLDSKSSSSRSVIPHVDGGVNSNTTALDDSQPITSGTRKPTDGDTLSVEEGEGHLVHGKSPKLTETLNYIGGSGCCAKPISRPGELVPPASCSGGKAVIEESFELSGLPSLNTARFSYGVESRISSSQNLESTNVEFTSLEAYEAPLFKAVKSGSVQGEAACSLDRVHQPNAENGLKTSEQGVVNQLKAPTLTGQNIVGGSSNIATRYKGLFSYEMFVKLYNWNKFELRPCGLVNCGNSCYANAVLQCLVFTPPLTAYFLQGLHSKSCEKKEWCFTCEFETLVLKAKEGISPLSPIEIISHLQDISCHLSDGREEDAHEFLRYAIDTMQSICLKEAGITESGSLGEVTTLIGLTFGGYLRSKIECMTCGGKSVQRERMMDITVAIDGEIRTLEEALRQFTRAETLDGDNKYQCGRCKTYEKARKKLKVLEAPNILSVVLKRFQSNTFEKLNKAIKFPEILNLAPYMSGTSDKSPIYFLYGVVVHLDITNAAVSGHYISYVKNIQNKWFKVDDSSVKEVELAGVLTKEAYMLLYARCSPRAPRLIRGSWVPRDPRKPKHHNCEPRTLSIGSQGPSNGSVDGQPSCQCSNPSAATLRPSRSNLEDYSSSDSSSFFSDVGSYSTESTNRDSISTDDPTDHVLGETGVCWHSRYTNSSDSDTSSSSSPSPLFRKQSPLADLDRYASGCQNTGGSLMQNAVPGSDSCRVQARSFSSSNLQVSDSRSSSMQADIDRLEQSNPFGKVNSGVAFRRSQANGQGA